MKAVRRDSGCALGLSASLLISMEDVSLTKTCGKCLLDKVFPEFNNSSANPDGKQSRCRSCQSRGSSKYHTEHRDERLPGMRARKKIWQKRNISRVNLASKIYIRERARKDPAFRILKNTRKRIWDALKGITKNEATLQLIGGLESYKAHIEKQFQDGWTWENYGSLWEIDHKIPCSKFDLLDPEQRKVCFHFSNTQPMLVSDNRSKGAKI